MNHRLTRDYSWIALEDLNVKGMLANGRLARHLADASFGELRRQLTYKAAQRGAQLALVDRWYPSSKTCSDCGAINEALTLGTRVWVWGCTACGAEPRPGWRESMPPVRGCQPVERRALAGRASGRRKLSSKKQEVQA